MYLVPVEGLRLREPEDVTTTPVAAIVFGTVKKVPQE
jgi:hypothetical protein